MELDDAGVNDTLARYSDLLFTTAISIYLLVAVMFIAALAGKHVGRAVDKEQELVGAAAGKGGKSVASSAADTSLTRTPGKVDRQIKRPLGQRMADMAYPVIFVGIIAHALSIVLRTMATGRTPLGNMYEFISMTTLACVVGGAVVLRKQHQRPMLAFVLLPVGLLMLLGGKWLYTHAAPLVPALQSYWITIHVTIISIASGVLMVSGIASILYLVKMQWGKSAAARVEAQPNEAGFVGAVMRIVDRIPSVQSLDRTAYKAVIFGFPLFGLGVICGAIWAEAAWGRFWGWDPKETVSFISWVLYAAYLHARATAGWRSRAAAWISVAGFISLLFNLFAINLVVSGLHSYAGL